ncbi:hypothetical protein H4J46_16255 [Colwellia sp. MB02u-6]|uniref:hypothetical protein n=1 Tax=Colwellia sp. MB02u-6 TaxID=2759824 RepID=UPI0015F6E687|nr:hypothetical protein [Colwellia sp. MB02u-6]MBA6329467.1 hypothetical protein [Colwellia sp. MB02u-6]
MAFLDNIDTNKTKKAHQTIIDLLEPVTDFVTGSLTYTDDIASIVKITSLMIPQR